MKYALVNDRLQEAQPGFTGKCPCCDSTTISKCGKIKIPHWAHKGKLMCDPWWENETEWHRKWKNCFPEECQEVVHVAENGEKHIADVKTNRGLVIEFQHSFIKPEERQSREDFYKNMIWIVDGTRRLRDKDKFMYGWENHSKQLDAKVAMRRLYGYYSESPLIRDWGTNRVPVFFDFGQDILWGLLCKTTNNIVYNYAFIIKRSELISYLNPASQMNFEVLLKSLHDFIEKREQFHSLNLERSQQAYYIRPLQRNRRRL